MGKKEKKAKKREKSAKAAATALESAVDAADAVCEVDDAWGVDPSVEPVDLDALRDEVRALAGTLKERSRECLEAAERIERALLFDGFGPSKDPKEAGEELARFLDGAWFDERGVPRREEHSDCERQGLELYSAECGAALWADELLRALCGVGLNEARVVGLHKARPWLSQRQVAEAVGASEKRVSRTVADLHLAWRKEPRPKDAARSSDTAMEGAHDGEGR